MAARSVTFPRDDRTSHPRCHQLQRGAELLQLGPTVRDWLDAAMVTGSKRKKHWGSITGFDTLSLTSRCKGPLDTRVNWVFGSPQIVFGPPLGLLVCIQTTLCFWSPAATRADFGSQCAKWEKAQTNRSHHRHGQTAAKKRAHDSSPAISGKATSFAFSVLRVSHGVAGHGALLDQLSGPEAALALCGADATGWRAPWQNCEDVAPLGWATWIQQTAVAYKRKLTSGCLKQ